MNIRESDHITGDLGIPTWTQNPRLSGYNRLNRLSIQVMQGKNFRLRAAATAAMLSALCVLRSVPFGKYWRSSPLMFSLVPRCHGL
jgi:hypothetical protein